MWTITASVRFSLADTIDNPCERRHKRIAAWRLPHEQSSRGQRDRLRPHDASGPEHRLRFAERDERLVLSKRNERHHHKLRVSPQHDPEQTAANAITWPRSPSAACHIVAPSAACLQGRGASGGLETSRIAEPPQFFDFIALREIGSCAILFSFVRSTCAPCETPGAKVKGTRRDLDLLGWIWICLVRFGLAGKTLNLAATKRLPHGFSRGWSGGKSGECLLRERPSH